MKPFILLLIGSLLLTQVSQSKIPTAMLEKAEKGNSIAQFNLGCLYESGEGVPKNLTKAIEWYLKSANQGLAQAQYNLAVIYAYGRDVPKDSKKAIEYFEKSANQDFEPAQYNLGDIYANGRFGVPKDSEKSIKWFGQAAKQGNAKAKAYLEKSAAQDNSEKIPHPLEVLNKKYAKKISEVNATYANELQKLKVKLTKMGDLENAIIVGEYLQKHESKENLK